MRPHALALGMVTLLGLACAAWVGAGDAPKAPVVEKKAKPAPERALTSRPGAPMQVHQVRDGKQRNAVCNDGTAATFFVDAGQGEGADDWVIFLKGGGACAGVDNCKARPGFRKTAYGRARAPDPIGILGDDPQVNEHFWDWNKVWLAYCSSDLWLGDRGASEQSGGMHFRGSRIVSAVIEDLKDGAVPGLPHLGEAGKVLFMGGSAGSAGMDHNLDRVAAALPGVRVLGVADSGGISFIASAHDVEDGPTAQSQHNYAFWNAQLDASCVAAEKEPATCMNATVYYDHIQTPRFIYMDQFDTTIMHRLKLTRDSDRGRAHAAKVRARLTAHAERGGGAFSTRTAIHVLSIKEGFCTLHVRHENRKRYTYADVLANWVYQRPGPRIVLSLPRE